jgi:hypothetical protein
LSSAPLASARLRTLLHFYPYWLRLASYKHIQCIGKCFSSCAHFRKPFSGYPFHQLFPARKELHEDASAVFPTPSSAQISARLQPINQFHCAVVLQHQAFRQYVDGRFLAFWKTPNREQQQILLGFEPHAPRRGITVRQKETYPVAQRG